MDQEIILQHYLECALWASPEVDENGQELFCYDEKYTIHDFSPEAVAWCASEIARFVEGAGALLDGWAPEQVGHDLWLTRNHHGAGFWDRNLPNGDALTELTHRLLGERCLREHGGLVRIVVA